MNALFPDKNPPMLPLGAHVDHACIWLLAVMDEDDRRRAFVASILNFYLDRGYITEKQMDAIRSLASRIVKQFLSRELESQGNTPAEKQTLGLGNVVEMRRIEDNTELFE